MRLAAWQSTIDPELIGFKSKEKVGKIHINRYARAELVDVTISSYDFINTFKSELTPRSAKSGKMCVDYFLKGFLNGGKKAEFNAIHHASRPTFNQFSGNTYSHPYYCHLFIDWNVSICYCLLGNNGSHFRQRYDYFIRRPNKAFPTHFLLHL